MRPPARVLAVAVLSGVLAAALVAAAAPPAAVAPAATASLLASAPLAPTFVARASLAPGVHSSTAARRAPLVAGSDCPFPLVCPWPAGQEWRVGGDGSFWDEEGHRNGDRFAVDCNRVDGEDAGQPVYATAPGVVVLAASYYGYGLCVIVRHSGGVESLYGHLARLAVKKGQAVTTATPLGTCGSSGWSSGSHLHFLVRRGGLPLRTQPLEGCLLRDGLTLTAARKSSIPPWLLAQPRGLLGGGLPGGDLRGGDLRGGDLRGGDLPGGGLAVLLSTAGGTRLVAATPTLTRAGDGRWSWRTLWRTGIGRDRLVAAVGDLEGDGDEAFYVLAGRLSGGRLSVVEESSRVGSPSPCLWHGAGGLWDRSQMVAGDLDGDGRTELCILRAGGGVGARAAGGAALYVAEAAGGTRAVAPTANTRALATAVVMSRVWRADDWAWDSAKLAAGDFDGDGRDELLALRLRGVGSCEPWLFEWSDATAAPKVTRSRWRPAWDWYRTTLLAGDVDGDGRDELVAVCGVGVRRCVVRVVAWPGPQAAPSTRTTRTIPVCWERLRALAADVDGDGRSELVLLMRSGSGVAGKTLDLRVAAPSATTTLWRRAPWGWAEL